MQILLLAIAVFFPLAAILLRKILMPQFTIEAKHIISFSFDFGTKSGLKEIDTDLLLYAIVKGEIGVASQLMKSQDFKADIFIKDFESNPTGISKGDVGPITLTKDAQDCLTAAASKAIKSKSPINSGYLLKAIITSTAIITIANKYQIPTAESIDLMLQNSAFKTLAKPEKRPSIWERIKQGLI